MVARVFWVSDVRVGRLAMMPRPRTDGWLADEVADWRASGMDCVVSLLDSQEVFELDLEDEESLCRAAGMDFLSFPISDRGVPSSFESVLGLVDDIVSRLEAGKAVGVHCRVGIGRSGLISACVLQRLGFAYRDVFPTLTRARGTPVPDTSLQEEWARGFGEAFGCKR